MVAATEPKTIQKAVQIAGTFTDEALRIGSIKKNLEKRGNGGEPSKDRNVREDNKRTRTGNAFSTTTNHVGIENTGTGLGNQGNQERGRAFMLGAEEARQEPEHIRERNWKKVRQLMSGKAKEKKQEEIVVVKDFPEVLPDDLSGLPPLFV
ncbi:hypothetical protein Tco_1155866 [Tanacetum coccineum]